MANQNINIKANLDTKSFDSSIRGMKDELRSIENQLGSKLLSDKDRQKLLIRFGEVKTALKDIKVETDRVGDAGNVFGDLTTFAGPAVAGFTAVGSAMSIIGIENEKVNDILVKTTQLTVALNSIQQIADVSKLKTLVQYRVGQLKNYVLQKLIFKQTVKDTTAIVAQGVATKSVGKSIGFVTKAQLLWNKAVTANPIGALVAGIVLLVGAITGLVLWLGKSNDEYDAQYEAIDGVIIKNEELRGVYNDNITEIKKLIIEQKRLNGTYTDAEAEQANYIITYEDGLNAILKITEDKQKELDNKYRTWWGRNTRNQFDYQRQVLELRKDGEKAVDTYIEKNQIERENQQKDGYDLFLNSQKTYYKKLIENQTKREDERINKLEEKLKEEVDAYLVAINEINTILEDSSERTKDLKFEIELKTLIDSGQITEAQADIRRLINEQEKYVEGLDGEQKRLENKYDLINKSLDTYRKSLKNLEIQYENNEKVQQNILNKSVNENNNSIEKQNKLIKNRIRNISEQIKDLSVYAAKIQSPFRFSRDIETTTNGIKLVLKELSTGKKITEETQQTIDQVTSSIKGLIFAFGNIDNIGEQEVKTRQELLTLQKSFSDAVELYYESEQRIYELKTEQASLQQSSLDLNQKNNDITLRLEEINNKIIEAENNKLKLQEKLGIEQEKYEEKLNEEKTTKQELIDLQIEAIKKAEEQRLAEEKINEEIENRGFELYKIEREYDKTIRTIDGLWLLSNRKQLRELKETEAEKLKVRLSYLKDLKSGLELDLLTIIDPDEKEKVEKQLDDIDKLIKKASGDFQKTQVDSFTWIKNKEQEQLDERLKTITEYYTKLIEQARLAGDEIGAQRLELELFDALEAARNQSKAETEKWIEQIKEQLKSLAEQISDTFVGVLGNQLQKTFQRLTKELDQRIEESYTNLEALRDADLIDDEEYNQQKDELDREAEVNRSKLEYDQAKRERELALISIAIDTAIGVAKSFGQGAGLFGAPLAAIVATQGALQAALVRSQPLPELVTYEQGGKIVINNGIEENTPKYEVGGLVVEDMNYTRTHNITNTIKENKLKYETGGLVLDNERYNKTNTISTLNKYETGGVINKSEKRNTLIQNLIKEKTKYEKGGKVFKLNKSHYDKIIPRFEYGGKITRDEVINIKRLETGGMINGNRHAFGGEVLEAEGGEFIVNRNAVAVPGVESILNMINTSKPAPNQVNTTNNYNTDTNIIEKIVNDTIKGVISIPVNVLESNISKTQRKVKTIETRSKW